MHAHARFAALYLALAWPAPAAAEGTAQSATRRDTPTPAASTPSSASPEPIREEAGEVEQPGAETHEGRWGFRRGSRPMGLRAELDIGFVALPVDSALLLSAQRLTYHAPRRAIAISVGADALGFTRQRRERIVPFLPDFGIGYDGVDVGIELAIGTTHIEVRETDRRGEGFAPTATVRARYGEIDGGHIRVSAAVVVIGNRVRYLNGRYLFRMPTSDDAWVDLSGSGFGRAGYAEVTMGSRYRLREDLFFTGYLGYGRIQADDDDAFAGRVVAQGFLVGSRLEYRRPVAARVVRPPELGSP